MITVAVVDIVATSRIVEVPETCPECKEPLAGMTLNGWEYQDQARCCAVRPREGIIDWDEDAGDLPEGGESYLGWCSIQCQCGHVLAEGRETRIP